MDSQVEYDYNQQNEQISPQSNDESVYDDLMLSTQYGEMLLEENSHLQEVYFYIYINVAYK